MNVVVVGAGVGGYHIASTLSREGHSVVVVEQSGTALENVRRYLDVRTVQGSGSNPRVLREAEAPDADLVVAFSASDETNMVSCLLAKALGAKRTVARVRNPEYSGYLVTSAKSPVGPRRVITPESLGIGLFVNPDIMAAEELASILSGFYAVSIEEFAEGRVQAREFPVESETAINKSVREIALPRPCVVAAVVRPTGIIMPARDEPLQKDDHVLVVSSARFMDELGAAFRQTTPPARSVVVVGGERVGFRLAQLLEKRSVGVKLIEPDPVRADEVAALLSKTEVVHGEGTDSELLVEEGVSESDAFIAASVRDESNILMALLAKSLGARRSLTVVERAQYVTLGEAVGLDVVLSPLLLAAGGIVRLVRSPSVVNMAFMAGSRLEVLEFVAGRTAPIANRRLGEVGMPNGAVVGAIVRGESVMLPRANTRIEPGDHVVVVSLPTSVPTLTRVFE